MTSQILTTKLYIPTTRSETVARSHLIDRLNQGLQARLTLVSAPAGFGKTTLISEWLSQYDHPSAWLSLDEQDNDPTRFLTYVIAALQTIEPHFGDDLLKILQSPQSPTIDTLLIPLINAIASLPKSFILVLDDYHVLDTQKIDSVLAFLLDNLPPQMHIVITTREDPQIPLAKYRARAELTELRADDLRFTGDESDAFLNQVMGLDLSTDAISALETRTEGWIASLQMVAISLKGQVDKTQFVETFTGSHRYILDYLLEEVLHQQSDETRMFLLQTSILSRLHADLCDAVMQTNDSQLILEQLERRNLFIIPLDNTRQWYRYHYLFADLLRQRMLRDSTNFSPEDVRQLHIQASIWYETNGLELEAFQHAVESDDIARAERLIESQGTPMYLRGIVKPILRWVKSLPQHTLDQHPSLWFAYASTLLLDGQHTLVEQTLDHADNALKNAEQNETTQDIMGRVASMRGTLAVIQHDIERMIVHAENALAWLHPNNVSERIAALWTRGFAYQLQGSYQQARETYKDVLQLSVASGNSLYAITSNITLGRLQELGNDLHQANDYYQRSIELCGEPSHPVLAQAFLGLARIHYQWNDLDAAQDCSKQCYDLLQQMENTDTTASYSVFLAYVHLSQNDFTRAYDILDDAVAFVRRNNFMFRMPRIAKAQVRVLIHHGDLETALQLAEAYDLPISQARIYLAQNNATKALEILTLFIQDVNESQRRSDLLKALILQALVYNALNQQDTALQILDESLALAKRGGLIRIFVDEGESMRILLRALAPQSSVQDYINKLLAAFDAPAAPQSLSSQPLIDALSERELEVLTLIADGLSNREISERLFIVLDTVKGHNRIIYQKLQVSRRTEAVARARELGLI